MTRFRNLPVLTLILGLFHASVFAENSWVDGLSLHLNLVSGISDLSFRNDREQKFKLTPNTEPHPGWGARYRNTWGFTVSQSLSGVQQADKHRPETRYFDIQPFYYGHKFGADFFYLYYRGFYRSESDSSVTANHHPSLKTTLVGLNLYYLLNHKSESLNYLLNPPADKNTGILFPVIWDFTRRRLTTPKPLTPAEADFDYPVFEQIRDISVYHTTLSQGIAYYISWRGLYVVPTLFVGLGPQFRDHQGDFIDPWGLAMKVNFKFVLGYQGDRFHFSVQGINNSDVILEKDEDLQFHSGQVIMSVGYSF
jgi:Domain of unknown function (DUF4421)